MNLKLLQHKGHDMTYFHHVAACYVMHAKPLSYIQWLILRDAITTR